MNSSTLQNLLNDASSAHDEMHHVMYIKEKEYERLPDKVLQSHLISEANWMMRKEYRSCDQLGVRIEIGDICFWYCQSLKEITIPNTVTKLGNYFFYYCTNLTKI